MKQTLTVLFAAIVFVLTLRVVLQQPQRLTPTSPRERESERTSGAMEALNFWTRSRAYPDVDIPQDKFYKAFLYSKRNLKDNRRSLDAVSTWQEIGPHNIGGRTIAIAVNPLNTSTIYAGSASGGLWRSHTAGVGANAWDEVLTGYPVHGVMAIAIDPTDTSTMYIGTGEVYGYQTSIGGTVLRTTRGSYGIGILKTTNNGATWTKSLDWTMNQQRGVEAMKINPLNHNTIYAATSEGTYKSTNAGATWTLVLNVLMGEDIIFNLNDTNKVMVSCGNLGSTGTGIYRTTNSGSSWDQLGGGLPSYSGKTLISAYQSNTNIVYASVADSLAGLGYYKTTDFGTSWTLLSTEDIPTYQGWYSHYVAPHPTNPNIVLAGGGPDLFKSTDGGNTFVQKAYWYLWYLGLTLPGEPEGPPNYAHADHHAYAFDPTNSNIIYFATDGGIFCSTDGGETFEGRNGGYQTSQFYNGFSCSRTDSNLSMGGMQDNASAVYYGTVAWYRVIGGDGCWSAINPINDTIMYGEYQYNNILKSTDRGVNFFYSTSGMSGPGAAFVSPYLIAPSQPTILYSGRAHMYKSTNAGSSWATTNGGAQLDGNSVLSLATSHTSPETVYAGTAPTVVHAHIFRTTNGGTSWTNVTGPLPDRYPMDLAVDPANSQVVYAAFSGFGTGHVFKSTDAGNNWSDITGTLPDVPTSAVIVDSINSSDVYVGNDLGVYVSANGGATWSGYNDGFPDAVIATDLSVSFSNRMLRVATHGNGVYQRKLLHEYPVSPFDYKPIAFISPPQGFIATIDSMLSSYVASFKYLSGLPQSDSIDVKYEILKDAVEVFSTTKRIPFLTLGETREVTFIGSYTPHQVGTYDMESIISASDNVPSNDTLRGSFTVAYPQSVTVQLNQRWNLISVPVTLTDNRVGSVFPTATNGTTYIFDGLNYVAKDTLVPGAGYWTKFPTAISQVVGGFPMSSLNIPVREGWNLVGMIDHSISPPSGGIIASAFYGYEIEYVYSTALKPGRAYWVKASAAGTISLGPTTEPKEQFNPFDGMSSISFVDRNSQRQTLYFTKDDAGAIDLEKYEMPPPPPTGIFDARFASQRILETFGAESSRDFPIEISSAEFPLSLRIDLKDPSVYVSLIVDGHETALNLQPNVNLSHQVSHIALRISNNKELPTEFSLSQNYPNPFNPSTKFVLALPRDADVRVDVFDMLGKKIATLFNGTKSAGYQFIEWNGQNDAGVLVTSGLYLIRMTTSGQTFARKVLLLK